MANEPRNAVMSLYFPTAAEHAQHTIFPGVTIFTCAAEKMMLSYVELAPHAVVEEHSHPHEQVGMLLEGRAQFFIGNEQKTLQRGDRYRIPGHVKHRVVALDEGAKALDIFCPIREDYL
jgi:quercetin dioxygenase-like cupin family protein